MAIEMREPEFCARLRDARDEGYGTILTVHPADESSTIPGYYVDFGDGEHVWMLEYQLDRVETEQCA